MNSIKLKVSFGETKAVFDLKVLTIAEENRIREGIFGLTEKEKEDKEFDLIVASLAEFSIEEVKVLDQKTDAVLENTPVSKFFAEKSSAMERIAQAVFRTWFVALNPSVDFL